MQKKPLEITCYVAGAGAFGVFFRWLQDQLAFDEAGLNEKSVFNLLVPALIVAAALLLMSSEADPHAEMIRVLCLLAALSGLAFPLVLGAANYEFLAHEKLVRLGMMLPVLMYALWLVLSYIQNSHNSVPWSFAVEIAAIIAAMLGFFRVAGFAFRVPDGHRALFDVMLGGAMCILALADERYMGMQLIFLASAGMLILYEWILVRNLKKKRPETKKTGDAETDDGGFEVVR